MMILTFIRKWWFVLLYLAIYFVAINLLVLNRFWQYETFYFDHGIFDQALWNVAHFTAPLIDHNGPQLLNQLGDHFNPALFLLSPLYWFTSSYEALYIVENIFVVLSAFVLFLIAKLKLANKLMIFALVLAYTLFIGMQNAILADFHPELLALLPLSLALWAVETNHKRLFWICIVLTLGLKELFAFFGILLSVYLFFRGDKKRAVILCVVSVLYVVVAVKILIPLIAQAPYYYTPTIIPMSEWLPSFFLPGIKTKTMVVTFLTFGLAPFAAFSLIPVFIQDYFVRFVLNSGSTRWDLGLHYNALPAVFFTYASIIGVTKLLTLKWYKKLITLHALFIIGMVLFFHRFLYHGPLGLTYNPDFYAHTKNFDPLRKFMKSIPAKRLTMAQNNLAPYLTHQTQVMLLRGDYYNYMPDIIVIDNHTGQNANAFWPSQEGAVRTLVETLDNDANYLKHGTSPGPVYYEKVY